MSGRDAAVNVCSAAIVGSGGWCPHIVPRFRSLSKKALGSMWYDSMSEPDTQGLTALFVKPARWERL